MFITIGALVALTVFDIVIHVATDQVEPLRITGNFIVLASALGVLLPRLRRVWIALAAGGWNLVLNLIHISANGIGALGVALIAVTTVLWLVLTILFARATKPVL